MGKKMLTKEERHVKLKEIQLNSNATRIQAVWRGKYMRNKLLSQDDDDDEENRQEVDDLDETQAISHDITSNTIDLDNPWPQAMTQDLLSSEWPLSPYTPTPAILHNLNHNKHIIIRTITWNLCAKKPPSMMKLKELLLPQSKFHLYFIGTEECERSIAQSAFYSSKRNWEDFILKIIGSEYDKLTSVTLQVS